MFFVYILQSIKNGRLYVGQTNNIKNRLRRHNKGLCSSTKYWRPWILIYLEVFSTRSQAIAREKYLKSLKSHMALLSYAKRNKRSSR